jgi:hypothetical protein
LVDQSMMVVPHNYKASIPFSDEKKLLEPAGTSSSHL